MKNNFLAVLAVFLIATVGCSKSESGAKKGTATSGGDSGAAAVTAIAPVVSGAPVIGEAAPEVTGPDTDGVMFNLSDYKGKVVMLDFWGDW